MNIKELREEIDVIEMIFYSAKYHELDFKYFHKQKFEYPNVYYSFRLLTDRIFHAASFILILDLCKLFVITEKFSLFTLRNKIIENYRTSELSKHMSIGDVEALFSKIESEEVQSLILKLKTTRDKYYAHLDRTKVDFKLIQLNSIETSALISIVETILKSLELHFFQCDTDYNIDKAEIGHNIFERLNEWEIYRKKYGVLKQE